MTHNRPLRIGVPGLLLLERRLEIGRFADQAGLALLADAAPEQRLDEDELVPVDQAWISSSVAPGPKISDAGNSTCSSRRAP